MNVEVVSEKRRSSMIKMALFIVTGAAKKFHDMDTNMSDNPPTGTLVRYKGGYKNADGGRGFIVHGKDVGTRAYPHHWRKDSWESQERILVLVDRTDPRWDWLKIQDEYPYFMFYYVEGWTIETKFSKSTSISKANIDLYCTCGGPAKPSMTFNGEPFDVCTTCKKEKR